MDNRVATKAKQLEWANLDFLTNKTEDKKKSVVPLDCCSELHPS